MDALPSLFLQAGISTVRTAIGDLSRMARCTVKFLRRVLRDRDTTTKNDAVAKS